MVKMFELLPGAPSVFRCERLHAALTPRACGELHVAESTIQCVGCTVGKAHAQHFDLHRTAPSNGDAHVSLAVLRCTRCCRVTHRHVGRALCVGCANRELELHRQRNRHGRPPSVTARRLHQFTVLLAGIVVLHAWRPESKVAAVVTPIDGGTLAELTAVDTDEVLRWAAVEQPRAQVVDIEQGPSWAEALGLPVPTPRSKSRSLRGRDTKLGATPLKPQKKELLNVEVN